MYLIYYRYELVGVLDTIFCDKIVISCDRLVVFTGYSCFFTNKTDHNNIIEILLKAALNTTTLALYELFGVLVLII